VRRQLDLFERDDAALVEEGAEAERAYDAAERDEAEEAFGDFQLVLEAMADRLEEIRDAYARTLDEDAARDYEASFTRAARKRFPKVPLT
jgi:hypothetical protein